jgi:hypothetical protein
VVTFLENPFLRQIDYVDWDDEPGPMELTTGLGYANIL